MARIFKKAIFITLVSILSSILIGGTLKVAESAQEPAQPAKPKVSTIESITISGEGNSAELVVKLSAPATYTSYKTTSPLRLVIDLSQVSPGSISTPISINKANFKSASVNRYETDAGVLTRLEIELSKDVEAVLNASPEKPGELRISFPAYANVEPAIASKEQTNKTDGQVSVQAKAETTVNDKPVSKKQSSSNNTQTVSKSATASADVQKKKLSSINVINKSIVLAIDGGEAEFKSFRLGKPERLVVDLFGVESALPSRIIPINSKGVASARIGVYPDKVRVVFDSVSDSMPELNAVRVANGISIAVTEKALSADSINKTATDSSQKSADLVVKQEQVPTSSKTNSETGKFPVKVDMIDFQVVGGVSRVSVKIAGQTVVDSPESSAGFVTLNIKNCTLPKQLQRSIETKGFTSPVLRVTPIQVKTRKGVDTKIRIVMRKSVPYEFRQEGDMVYVDFKNPENIGAIKQAQLNGSKTISDGTHSKASRLQNELSNEVDIKNEQPVKMTSSGKVYKGRKVTLEFADAEVRKIFQLLSEVSNKNFVLGDDVTGTISIKLVNVPWDQALDIILDTKGLDKREEGNIVVIKGKGKFKSQAEEDLEIKKQKFKSMELTSETFSVNYADLQGVVTQFNALKSERGVITPDARTNKVIVKDIPLMLEEMRKVLVQLDIPEKQVMIEARIVEATSTFTQSLGVNWGVHYDSPASILYGVNKIDSGIGGLTTAPPTSGVGTSPGLNTGISFGTLGGNVKLDMRLSAAASAGLIKIVSSPKIATLNNKAAKITQGQSVPYTSSTSDKVETKFVEAALALEVTPHINPNGTISIKIDAKNDSVGTVPAGATAPSINKKQATTEMLLRDGETTVIGGIYVDSDTSSDEGVPFMMDIPIFGNLFKTKNKTKIKTELLIFITPRIIVNIN